MQRHRRWRTARCMLVAAALIAAAGGCGREETKAAPGDAADGGAIVPIDAPAQRATEAPDSPPPEAAPDDSEKPDKPDDPKAPRRPQRRDRSDESLLEISETEVACSAGLR
ncbi:MAG: hypothetical protein GX591_01190 [Planctomycetes bacterium]|nr:hypothetical protein [Planctomycetota bacterium]